MTIDGVPLLSLTPSVLLGVAVLLILTGRLVPRRTYDDLMHDRNEALTSSRIKDTQIAEKDRQIEHLIEVGRTVEAIMRAIPHPPEVKQ